MSDENHPWYPEVGKVFPDGSTVIAWGHVNAHVEGKDHDRLCVLALLSERDRIPNQKNYVVYYWYPPSQIPPGTPPNPNMALGLGWFEAGESFPNIVPAVECYKDWGMDY